jgi:hypothetical protein
MRRRWHRLLFPLLVAIPLAVACGEDATIPSLVDLPDGAVAAVDGGDGVESDAGDAAPPACPPVSPDDTRGVYVSTNGSDADGCGTRDAPCKSITAGLARAVAAAKGKVYVARGVYTEKVTLVGGITVEGGWEAAGATWTQACSAADEAVVVRAPASETVTVVAKDLGGSVAGLSTLRVESKAAGAVDAGESIYGIAATGATTTLTLTDVLVDVGSGGNGTNGSPGDGGIAGDAAGCGAAGDAAAGTPGSIGSGAPSGTFAQTGYVLPNAAAGAAGAAGQNGTAGAPGSCVDGGSCVGAPPGCTFVPGVALTCGATGLAGCGGAPGTPGVPGSAGGSAIGVFAWDAIVQITGGHVHAGDGGSGGNGGAGGSGGSGGAGAKGASQNATTSCTNGVAACVDVQSTANGGAAGTTGGAGGAGGAGGGGAGGWSVAIYLGGAGVVTTTNATLTHGKAGAGGGPDGGAGSVGTAADHIP